MRLRSTCIICTVAHRARPIWRAVKCRTPRRPQWNAHHHTRAQPDKDRLGDWYSSVFTQQAAERAHRRPAVLFIAILWRSPAPQKRRDAPHKRTSRAHNIPRRFEKKMYVFVVLCLLQKKNDMQKSRNPRAHHFFLLCILSVFVNELIMNKPAVSIISWSFVPDARHCASLAG